MRRVRAATSFPASLALGPKDQAALLVTQTLCFFRILLTAESLGDIEKLPLLPLFSFDSVFDQLDQHTSGTERSGLCHGAYLQCDIREQNDAQAHRLRLGSSHVVIMREVLLAPLRNYRC